MADFEMEELSSLQALFSRPKECQHNSVPLLETAAAGGKVAAVALACQACRERIMPCLVCCTPFVTTTNTRSDTDLSSENLLVSCKSCGVLNPQCDDSTTWALLWLPPPSALPPAFVRRTQETLTGRRTYMLSCTANYEQLRQALHVLRQWRQTRGRGEQQHQQQRQKQEQEEQAAPRSSLAAAAAASRRPGDLEGPPPKRARKELLSGKGKSPQDDRMPGGNARRSQSDGAAPSSTSVPYLGHNPTAPSAAASPTKSAATEKATSPRRCATCTRSLPLESPPLAGGSRDGSGNDNSKETWGVPPRQCQVGSDSPTRDDAPSRADCCHEEHSNDAAGADLPPAGGDGSAPGCGDAGRRPAQPGGGDAVVPLQPCVGGAQEEGGASDGQKEVEEQARALAAEQLEGALVRSRAALLALHCKATLDADVAAPPVMLPICSAACPYGPARGAARHVQEAAERPPDVSVNLMHIAVLRIAFATVCSGLVEQAEEEGRREAAAAAAAAMEGVVASAQQFLEHAGGLLQSQREIHGSSRACQQAELDCGARLAHAAAASAAIMSPFRAPGSGILSPALGTLVRQRSARHLASHRSLVHPHTLLLPALNKVLRLLLSAALKLHSAKPPNGRARGSRGERRSQAASWGKKHEQSEAIRTAYPLCLLLYHDVYHATHIPSPSEVT